MRGVVTLAGVQLGAPGELRIAGATDPAELRSWALYWDKISVPETAAVKIERSGDFSFLMDCGLLEERFVNVGGGEVSDIFRKARREVFEHYERATPGSWSMATGMEEHGQDPQQRAIRVHLAAALPVPTGDVPLDEILEFKQRHGDLREKLFAEIDEAYLSIISSPDKPVAEHLAITKLMSGAKAHFDEVNKSSWRYKLMDVAADFNLAPALIGAVSIAGVTAYAGATWPLIVGNSLLAGASVTVSQVTSLFKRSESKSPYRYLTAFREEVYGADV